MKEDVLYEAARFYKDNLENKRFLITVGDRKRKETDIEVFFSSRNFFHLVGLQHINDVPLLRRFSPTIVYSNILSKNITYSDIEKSSNIEFLKGRLDEYKEILKIFSDKSTILKALKGYFATIKADYMLSRTVEPRKSFLFLRNEGSISIPCSFFVRDDAGGFYYKQGSHLTILSVKDITNEAREERKSKNTPSTSTPAAKVPATVGAAVSQPTDAASASGTPQSNNAASQPNPTTAQSAVSAAASSMFGNMPTVQAQNPQSIHTKQNKNDDINE